ncbi:hypothetical protein [Edaphobacter albus]|uniref:hypothetical protein n=1 Tax=Edaphobacter sp. 4G125 TaxID=2763071 RepID=UPI001645A944|nr:hypothetical protein [Edaphobacter sp. 4G125]QNI37411.1 hypothetical protein H7846_03600 [Edaphobacter sp. 4G125]
MAKDSVRLLGEGPWSLDRAMRIAQEIQGQRRVVKALVETMFGEDAELRKRAADVACRVTDNDASALYGYADELAGLLAEIALEESRTRWHLGLVVARVAHTREQRLRAAGLMELLIEDESNVTRCSAVEGIGLLACEEASLREIAEEIVEQALREGTPAMKARARHAKRRLAKIDGKSGTKVSA